MSFSLRKIQKQVQRWIGFNHQLPLQIDITNRCNLNCVHCYHDHHENNGALMLQEWQNIFLQYLDIIESLSLIPSLVICGGEPLLSPILMPLIEFVGAQSPRIQITILTNGILAHRFNLPANINFLRQNITFQISLDGHDQKSHDAVRGFGTFKKTCDGIRHIKNQGFSVYIQAILSRRTVANIFEFFDLALDLDLKKIKFTRLIEIGQAKSLVANDSDMPLVGLNLKMAYQNIVINSARTRIESPIQGPLSVLVHPKLRPKSRFWEGIVIDYQGNLLVSSRSRYKLGNLKEVDLKELYFNHSILNSIRKGEIETCSKCKFLSLCGGDRNAAFAATGNFLSKDPGCWI